VPHNQENRDMLFLPLDEQDGLRWNDKASDPGAQTERRGEAGPVRDLLGG
jgi:hypothetical protein